MRTLFLSILLLCFTALYSQNYKTAVGVRAGLPSGLTLKHFIADDKALEGILAVRWNHVGLTGLYEKHVNAFGVENLYWYYGLGAHVGYFYSGRDRRWGYGYATPSFGVDGILGLEYQITEIPFTVGLDYKPALNIYPLGLWWDEFALSFRYTF